VVETSAWMLVGPLLPRPRIAQPTGAVDVETDLGQIVIESPAAAVRVTSRGGDVRVSGARGTVDVTADGPLVDVGWEVVSREANQTIENPGGDVRLQLPGHAACRVHAESEYGRVESAHPGIRATDDGSAAVGALGGAQQPTLRVVAGGDIFIEAGPGTKPPPGP